MPISSREVQIHFMRFAKTAMCGIIGVTYTIQIYFLRVWAAAHPRFMVE
jgi:hypothetical protein